MENQHYFTRYWRAYLSEMAGTALLLLIGLSIVIFLFAAETPMAEIIPNVTHRRMLSGFLFGATGGIISMTAIGRESGAHINPAVTMVFFLFGKIEKRAALAYVISQLMGAVIGCLPLFIWGAWGDSIDFGATYPGVGYTVSEAFWGEVSTTFIMVSLLIVFIGFRSIRPFTPMLFPFLYSIMVPIEAAISGTSTNPARSFGPAVVTGIWDSWWIYWAGPILGALLASLVFSALAKRITVAKLYHFDTDRDGLFRRKGTSVPSGKGGG
ncbi:aquaporin [Algoriphagus sp. AK58]|uniref:MIP/aquaporin family protein n=1 Tax=Algoriphagus sp. AK58 TaxID=1406877 RepID=UPI00164F45E8